MIRLVCVPGTRSTVVCAALEETGAPYEIVQVARPGRDHPAAFRTVSPDGPIPALQDGDVRLSEPAAILLHLGDRFPDSPLAPPVGSPARAEYYRWVAYLTNTLQAAYARWYAPLSMTDDPRLAAALHVAGERDLQACLDDVETQLDGRSCLVPDRFTAADLLLHMLVSPSWTMDLEPPALGRPHLARLHASVDARPAVRRMLEKIGPGAGD